jgi:hypothetical protein
MKISFAEAKKNKAGYSAVRLAYLLWEQRVAGSNPATPTRKAQLINQLGFYFSLKSFQKIEILKYCVE